MNVSFAFSVTPLLHQVWSFLCLAELCHISCVSQHWKALVRDTSSFRHIKSLTLHETASNLNNQVCGRKTKMGPLPMHIPLEQRCPPRHILNRILMSTTQLSSIHIIRCTHTCESCESKATLVPDPMLAPLEFPSSSLTSVTLCGSVCDADVVNLVKCSKLTTFILTSTTHSKVCSCTLSQNVSKQMWQRLATELPPLSTINIDSCLASVWAMNHSATLRSFTCSLAKLEKMYELLHNSHSLQHIHLTDGGGFTRSYPAYNHEYTDRLEDKDNEVYHTSEYIEPDIIRTHWINQIQEDINSGKFLPRPLQTCRGIIQKHWCDDDMLRRFVQQYPFITDLSILEPIRYGTSIMINPVSSLSLLPLRKLSLSLEVNQMMELLPSLHQLIDLKLWLENITREMIAGLPTWTPALERLSVYWHYQNADSPSDPLVPADWLPLQQLSLTHFSLYVVDGRDGIRTWINNNKEEEEEEVKATTVDVLEPIITSSVFLTWSHLKHLSIICADGDEEETRMEYTWSTDEIREFGRVSTASLETMELYIAPSTLSVWTDVLSSASVFQSLRAIHLPTNDHHDRHIVSFIVSHPIVTLIPFHSIASNCHIDTITE